MLILLIWCVTCPCDCAKNVIRIWCGSLAHCETNLSIRYFKYNKLCDNTFIDFSASFYLVATITVHVWNESSIFRKLWKLCVTVDYTLYSGWQMAIMWSVIEYLLRYPACFPDWLESSFPLRENSLDGRFYNSCLSRLE